MNQYCSTRLFKQCIGNISDAGTVGSFRKYDIGGSSPISRRGGIEDISGWVLRKTTNAYFAHYRDNYGNKHIGGIQFSRRVTTFHLSISGGTGVSYRFAVGTNN